MFANQYEEHLASQPDNSCWDGFDRGDTYDKPYVPDAGERVIGRMTNGAGQRVVIRELWHDGDYAYEVYVDGDCVYSDFLTEDRNRAIEVARWWMDGCRA